MKRDSCKRVSWVAIPGSGMDVLYPHTVLYQPLVDCFCWMRHEDPSPEVGFGQDIGQRRGMVKMEAETRGSAWSFNLYV